MERTFDVPGTEADRQQEANAVNQIMNFTPEEARAVRECGREAALQRGVPGAVVAAAAVGYFVRAGKLKASAKWGAAPKMVAAALVGYTVGKISYHQTCMEKLMALPNSALAERLCQTYRRTYTGWSDAPQQPPAEPYGGTLTHEPASPGTDYASLRLANRVALQQQQQQQIQRRASNPTGDYPPGPPPSFPSSPTSYPPPPADYPAPSSPPYPSPPAELPPSAAPRQRRNKYGDLIDE